MKGDIWSSDLLPCVSAIIWSASELHSWLYTTTAPGPDLHAQVTITRVSTVDTMAKVTVHTCVILLNVQCSVTPEQMFVISIHMHVPYTASVAECTQLRLDMSSPCGVQGYGHVIWTGDSVPAGKVATCRDLGFSRSLAFFTGTASL